MIVCTDNCSFAETLLGTKLNWLPKIAMQDASALGHLAEQVLQSSSKFSADVHSEPFWTHTFVVERAAASQFDLLAEALNTNRELPDRLLCFAGSGEGFHGQNMRPWAALPGNVHLTALFRPDRKLANCGIGFTVIGVVTVLQIIDSLGIERAQVKWVNDILIEEAKVGGVLVHIKTQGERVTSALLGIGLNVETRPIVEPDLFVPHVAALKDFSADPLSCNQGLVFRKLSTVLADNYVRYIRGGFPRLIDIYRQRSIVCGNIVTVYEEAGADRPKRVVTGKVVSIGENLELRLEGTDIPVWKGRLVLEDNTPDSDS